MQALGGRAAARCRAAKWRRRQPAEHQDVQGPGERPADAAAQRRAQQRRSRGRAHSRPGRYAASAVLVNAAGEPVALLDAQLPAAEFDRSAASYRNEVIVFSADRSPCCSGSPGILYGLWLAAPVVRLAEMARRIGHGDFSPAVPTVVPRELDALAHAMDDMRHNLIELTASLRRQRGARHTRCWPASSKACSSPMTSAASSTPIRSSSAAHPAANAEVIGRFCGDVLHPQLRAGRTSLRARLPDHRRTPAAARHAAPSSCAWPTARCARPSWSARRRPTGRQVQLLRDETDLEAARRARDSVLGNISHEFRTPLAAQLASIELLRDGLGNLSRGAAVRAAAATSSAACCA